MIMTVIIIMTSSAKKNIEQKQKVNDGGHQTLIKIVNKQHKTTSRSIGYFAGIHIILSNLCSVID